MESTKTFTQKVRDCIDLIYHNTYNKDFTESWKQYNNRTLDETLAIMVKRGILSKEKYFEKGKIGRRFTFTWIAGMAPTNQLAISIADEIREIGNLRNRKRRAKLKLAKQESIRVFTEAKEEEPCNLEDKINETAPAPIRITVEKLKSFSSQELWNELKSRGYFIEQGKLVRKKWLD